MADVGQSVLQRLKNKAQSSGRSFQLILQLFCQEEFLRRVTKSRFNKNLVLKGGLFLYSLSGFESRPTMDVDFLLRHISNQFDKVQSMVKEIISVDTGNDYVGYEIKGVEKIADHREYNGVRVQLIGQIKNTKTPFDVDFGVGDVIVPKPEERKLPVQLEGFEQPEVLTYSLESIIAEKWDAILARMELSSRMKDYYDIYYLAYTYRFEARKLQEAIFETLQNRGTIYEKDSLERVAEFINDNSFMVKWRHFCKRTMGMDIDAAKVLKVMIDFVGVPFNAMLFEKEVFDVWNPETMQYETG